MRSPSKSAIDEKLFGLATAAGYAMAAPDDEIEVQSAAAEFETPWAKAAIERTAVSDVKTQRLALLPAPVVSQSTIDWLRSFVPSLGRGHPA